MISWLVFVTFAVVAIVFHKRLTLVEQRLLEITTSAPRDEALAAVEPESQPPEAATLHQPLAASVDTSAAKPIAAQPQISIEEPHDEPAPRTRIDFEELFGRRLPIWAGGITLAIAGMFIVKLSIDSGLLTPPIRVIAGLLFGTVLIAAAEVAYRQEHRVRDPRV
ncbi:MAG: DUF2339 domain-containing protein, partial [Pseudomonadota bacterium]|nr:DUF2339 domain-containing protein [Pseudomonadota bacterium]